MGRRTVIMSEKGTRPVRLPRRRLKGFGEVAEFPLRIGGRWWDQAAHGPTPHSTAVGNASARGESQTSPSASPTAIHEALTRRKGQADEDIQVNWLSFDFEAPPEPPRCVVDGLFERATVNVVSSDTGVGKTWLSCSLIAAVLAEAEWLGRPVEAQRVIAVDEENPAGVIRARLRAFGATNEQAERLWYSSREGVSLGAENWNRWLIEQAAEHSADLILVDTAMVATCLGDVNDNTEVASIYKCLRTIAEEADAAIVLFHHHRKSQGRQPRSGGQEMMGGRQWAGQADAHLTLSKRSAGDEEQKTDDGTSSFNVELRVEKLRNGIEPPPEELRIVTRSEDGCLQTASVESLGEVVRARSKTEVLGAGMREVLKERGSLKSAELYAAFGEDTSQRSLERARRDAVEAGWIVKVEGSYGVYAAGDKEPSI
jgi:AAA domain